MALRAEGIGHVYDGGTSFAVPALEGVDASVERGRLLLIVGPSGSGKSTLLEILAGLLAPSGGRVTIDDVDVSDAPQLLRGRVGLVFQNPESQLFAETVEADIAFGPRNLGVPAEESAARVREALAAVGLDAEAFRSRSPFTLSGGEARRIAIAGVLAMRPAYLLLDEPTAGLDAGGRHAVLGALEEARRTAGVAVVTHDPEEFLALADEVIAIDGGRCVGRGRLPELLHDRSVLEGLGLALPEIAEVQMLALGRVAAGGPGAQPVPALALDVDAAADALLRLRGRAS